MKMPFFWFPAPSYPGYCMQYVITAYVRQFLCQVLKSICIHCYDMIFFCLQNRQMFGGLKYKYRFLDLKSYHHEFICFGKRLFSLSATLCVMSVHVSLVVLSTSFGTIANYFIVLDSKGRFVSSTSFVWFFGR